MGSAPQFVILPLVDLTLWNGFSSSVCYTAFGGPNPVKWVQLFSLLYCLWWTYPCEMGLSSSVCYTAFGSCWFLLLVHFLLCFSAFHCSLFPLSCRPTHQHSFISFKTDTMTQNWNVTSSVAAKGSHNYVNSWPVAGPPGMLAGKWSC